MEDDFTIKKEFTATIDRLSSQNNGIVEMEGGQVNVGPLTPSAVGEEVTVKLVTDTVGICADEQFQKGDYMNEIRRLALPRARLRRNSGKQSNPSYSMEPLFEQLNSTTGSAPNVEFCDECGSLMRVYNGQWNCDNCGNTMPHDDTDSGPSSSEHSGGNESDDSVTTTVAASPEPSSDTSDEGNLAALRDRAEQQAVKKVPEDSVTATREKPQYNRSEAVKLYVKARADGTCEGCGEPAPFESKTGEPYLHAHHVNELSDGGSDTVETVIALCPNCHYRVHHGVDGDEYNERLRLHLRDIEGKTEM